MSFDSWACGLTLRSFQRHSICRFRRWPPIQLLACVAAMLFVAGTIRGQRTPTSAKSALADNRGTAEAAKLFASTCAGCHGLDGRGGERGPNIASRQVQAHSDVELQRTVHNGISETGMPNFAFLGDARIEALVHYLRVLQGNSAPMPMPGDPRHGQTLFFGAAKCANCHMVSGQGGFLASDLSTYAAGSSPPDIRRAIVSPGREHLDDDHNGGEVSVTFLDGTSQQGVVRNHDNFSLQLQSFDGAFYLIQKADLAAIKPSAQSLMPDDYGKTLSASELNDIVSYLMQIAEKQGSKIQPKGKRHQHD
jgi:putative heme-binding domain-containing protein